MYLLDKGEQFSGVVGNYENPTANIELSSTRAYMFYGNFSQSASDVEFSLGYDNSGAVALDLHVEEYYENNFGSGFIGIGAESSDESVGQLTQVYELEPLTLYRVWVENTSADTTTSLNDFRANGRRFRFGDGIRQPLTSHYVPAPGGSGAATDTSGPVIYKPIPASLRAGTNDTY